MPAEWRALPQNVGKAKLPASFCRALSIGSLFYYIMIEDIRGNIELQPDDGPLRIVFSRKKENA